MGKIDELIKQMCPEGVKTVKLGEICSKITDGSHNPPQGLLSSNFRMISSQNIFNDRLDIRIDNVRYLSEEDHIKENKRSNVQSGDILLTIVGTIGRCYVVKEEDLPFTCQRSVGILKPIRAVVNSYFLKHYLIMIVAQLESKANGAAQKGLYLKQISDIEIPLPPLPIQEAIVEILDKFDRLSAELQAELQARKTQYEYYRNQLLTRFAPDQQVKEYSLGELCTDIFSGATPSKSVEAYWENGNIPWMSSGEVNYGQVYDVEGRITQLGYDKCSTKMVPVNSVVIALAGQGKTRGTVAIIRKSVCTNQSLAALVPNTNLVCGDYLYYYLRTQYTKLRDVSAGDGTRGGLNLQTIRKFVIQVPSLSEQARIVSILDKFEALVNDLSQGLPAEIEAVKEQYEYYRNKLLTFEKMS